MRLIIDDRSMRRLERDGASESCREHAKKVGEDSVLDAAADGILKCGGAAVRRRFVAVGGRRPSHFSVAPQCFLEREREA